MRVSLWLNMIYMHLREHGTVIRLSKHLWNHNHYLHEHSPLTVVSQKATTVTKFV
ncbi:uncharacterized protein CYBJADRAFT_165807 [Cyberlindnera jadinii NRRL Y-1542]|uniref:Uncharacterized protein n=1 Tax=Cyberlindnera jadinii (strain ATCC 18201 / CBS 1600 / BCRC 20928 / JCM 3617 / NBRC 0987 / NRRL Y-1542) TaxID=983966 RepID=A0A1E4SAK5_CYBJN|nr:hypothetical protein CYBJADRAFT_165807 [Cyberlindnera jadinii NRRL Y-1542]ODV76539.1 hypothetical protein CYBJADRAFT_165807 [Cyberlindnera jadinii NRRL Y-1542]